MAKLDRVEYQKRLDQLSRHSTEVFSLRESASQIDLANTVFGSNNASQDGCEQRAQTEREQSPCGPEPRQPLWAEPFTESGD